LLAGHGVVPGLLSPRLAAFHAGAACEMRLGPFAGGRRAMRTRSYAVPCGLAWHFQFRTVVGAHPIVQRARDR
jgi:hypothetical protein